MSDINIWENIDFKSDKKKILDYLNEQDDNLQKSTSGILKMSIETVTSYLDETPIRLVQLYKLYVLSENLGNFRTKLITIVQNNSGAEFPVEIFSHIEDKKYTEIKEENFLEKLNEILSIPTVQSIIVNLYKQSLLDD